MKHRDDARDPADEGHVVLDHHHRRPRIQFQDQLRHAHGFLVAHASRRLVEQNHLGFARHHHADLHHWRWPWASSPTSLRATARSPSRAFSCSARSRAAREPQALLAASHRFSSTVRPSSTVGTWF